MTVPKDRGGEFTREWREIPGGRVAVWRVEDWVWQETRERNTGGKAKKM
jgi:hypothetical protein